MTKSKRTPKGQFKNGSSGNPAGRPAGSRNKNTLACEQLLDGEAELVMRKAVELAKEGNVQAIKLCVERILPVRKERCINLDLTPIEEREFVLLPGRFEEITLAVAEGKITPGEGELLASISTRHVQASLAVTPDWPEQLQSMGVELWEVHDEWEQACKKNRTQERFGDYYRRTRMITWEADDVRMKTIMDDGVKK